MVFAKLFILALIVAINLQNVYGHGRMMDPVNRSSAWRKYLPVPKHYEDDEHFCGGISVQHYQNGGKCGECGDNYAWHRPRPNENGGKYGTGIIVQRYKAGSTIVVTVLLTTSHWGHFEFSLCPLKAKTELETDECFNKYPLPLADGSGYEFRVRETKVYKIPVNLPKGLTCEHCVLRWHYRAGNNWGTCDDGTEDMGCGPQENYRSCADVSITN